MEEEEETTEQTEGNVNLTVAKTERALKGVYKSFVKTKEKRKHLQLFRLSQTAYQVYLKARQRKCRLQRQWRTYGSVDLFVKMGEICKLGYHAIPREY